MSLIIPQIEVDRLIDLMDRHFYAQKGARISQHQTYFEFITPRVGTVVGAQLRTLVQDQYVKLRIYVVRFELTGKFGLYKQEMIANTDNGPGDSTYVAICLLPRGLFPVLSKNVGMPEYVGPSVDRPFDKQAMLVGASPPESGTIQYLTSKAYPSYHDDQTKSEPSQPDVGTIQYLTSGLYPTRQQEDVMLVPSVPVSGTIQYLTSPLYPIRSPEGAKSLPVLTMAELFTPPTVDEYMSLGSDMNHFLLGVNPYAGGIYTWTRATGENFEAMNIGSDASLWVISQTYFPIDQDYYDNERMKIWSDTIGFEGYQTYFPIDYNYVKSGGDTNERMGIASGVSGFSLGT